MSDQALFTKALHHVGGQIQALANACGVTRPTIYLWQSKVNADPPEVLTLHAKLKLRKAAGLGDEDG